MKKIALDLDGVVFDSENLYRVYTEIYDIDKFGTDNLIDNSPRVYQNRYNWPQEEFQLFYNLTSKKILSDANIMTGADIVIKKLLKKFEIIIVTARTDDEVLVAKEKLKEIGLTDVRIYNDRDSKTQRILDEKCNYLIDDDLEICRNAAQNGVTCIYFKNAASNIIENTNNLKVVNNWGEVYKYLILNNKD